jgi:ubiquinone biosynthesis O-methyltransferase
MLAFLVGFDGHCRLAGQQVLDVGCGGGLLSEGMCSKGAVVTGIDLSDKALSVAKLHLLESGLSVNYRRIAAEELAGEQAGHYDVVTCLEMLEHVPDPASTIAACATLVKPGGHRDHAGFLDDARHCGFVIKLCRPFRARTQGKVECFNGYLRRS